MTPKLLRAVATLLIVLIGTLRSPAHSTPTHAMPSTKAVFFTSGLQQRLESAIRADDPAAIAELLSAGAQANDVFVTPTSNVAVRGTEGDIAVEDDDLTVNVYTSNTTGAPPVVVTFTQGSNAGTTVNVLPGQSLTARLINGIRNWRSCATEKVSSFASPSAT